MLIASGEIETEPLQGPQYKHTILKKVFIFCVPIGRQVINLLVCYWHFFIFGIFLSDTLKWVAVECKILI